MNLETMATTYFLITLTIYKLFIPVGPSQLLDVAGLGRGQFSVQSSDLTSVSSDFGMLKSPEKPLAILNPSSSEDIANLIRSSHNSATSFPISARGHGHSINGQASTGRNGVIISMSHQKTTPKPIIKPEEMYVDVWGGDLWIDVLKKTLEYGLAPKSWTDYLYLSIGGTLSNGGISGQAFHYGPQISNVLELDVVTGKGEVMKCSEKENSRLFHGVLGGLGQFGIITRARISLELAPQRVRWIRVLYSSFEVFSEDQEYLISMKNGLKFDYVEGFVIVDEGLVNNWRSSFFSPSNPVKISSVSSNGSVLYCLEITKNYNDFDSDSIDQEIEILMKKLNFIPTSVFTTDLPYIDFLDRVHKAELKLRSKNLWEVPHPWLNIFVPKSRISDFDKGVFKGILGNKTSGPILIYPMNKDKWDERSSAVTPNEEVFYLVALLRSALSDGEETQKLEYLKDQNRRILEFCDQAGINVKQYLPHYTNQEDWVDHFGDKWDRFRSLKAEFDPSYILATGQKIFENPSRSLFPAQSSSSSASS